MDIVYLYEHEIVIRLLLIWLFHLEIFDWIVCSFTTVQYTHALYVWDTRKYSTRARTTLNCTYINATGDILRRITNNFLEAYFSSTPSLHIPPSHPTLNHLYDVQNKSTLRNGFCFASIGIELGNHCFSNYRFILTLFHIFNVDWIRFLLWLFH